ncbi:MAG TPA: maleylpyruvate isomerase family mycothiol-dependent enzyme [Streptosporangiaceae bacterium]|nr:maleylpyruvate isomerase family mycothiol-dependent enzyme [Streptosporangiaceae bacterium]
MEPDRLLSVFRAEAAHITVFGTGRDPGAPVPSCPDRTAGEVIRHLGGVYRRVAGWIRAQAPPQTWETAPAAGADLIDWFQRGADDLYAELARRAPGEPCATWWPYDETVHFWWRRMAHETLVHRTDIESAFGPVGPIDRDVATDGVDEVLTTWLGYRLIAYVLPETPPERRYHGTGQVIGVAAGTRVWRVELRESSVDISPELPHDADALVLGGPAEVYLWLWGRRDDTAVRITGDRTATTALRAALTAATQ